MVFPPPPSCPVQVRAPSNKFLALEIRFFIFLFDYFFISFGVVSFDNVPFF
jgi:hypothetical protein